MTERPAGVLADILARRAEPEFAPLRQRLAELAGGPPGTVRAELILLYRKAIPLVENALWRDGMGDAGLARYQALFHELEALIAGQGLDRRHEFVIVIPVADRPRQLGDCLASLLELCRAFGYGGRRDGRWRKVSVLLADDSREAENIARHRAMADDCTRQGLRTHHLGQAEQLDLLGHLPEALRARLAPVLGEAEPAAFHHKGAAITRNLACLWLNRLPDDGARRLFWFLDSDQEFRVNVAAADGERTLHAVNYLHWLDRVFTARPIQVLTGKVVGDPPVSPAVMAGNFLDDVLAFLADMAARDPRAACAFHTGAGHPADDAAYHDMADLFGFRPAAEPYSYRCPIRGDHDHAACLADFAGRLGRFFDGEHPTRRTAYRHADLPASVSPARTIYTGNYVVTPAGLDWFIPFAALKLRMAGPTLGRIVRAEIGGAFVSANLPMLHRRTVDDLGRSEFRPGLDRADGRVDLSGEFERQYFGDVMLFAMERLTGQGFPGADPGGAAIARAVDEAEVDLQARYRAKHADIQDRLARLDALFSDPARWWQGEGGPAGARAAIRRFIDNLRDNFADQAPAWRLVTADSHRAARRAAIAAAIGGYRDQRTAWRQAMGRA